MGALIVSIIGAAAAAISSAVAGGITAYKNNKQARQLQASAKRLQSQVETKEINTQEALKRLNALINTTKGDLRANIGKAVQDTIYNYKKEYEKALKIGTQQIKNAMVSRGLGGSQAMAASENQLNEKLQQNYAQNVKNLTEDQLNKLNQLIIELNKMGYDKQENLYNNLENFKLDNQNQIMQLDALSNQLDTGAGGVIGNIATPLITGGATNPKTVTAIAGALTDYTKQLG